MPKRRLLNDEEQRAARELADALKPFTVDVRGLLIQAALDVLDFEEGRFAQPLRRDDAKR